MDLHDSHHTVLIAGGGPVGLFLALCLERTGIPCMVAEKRVRPVPHSRSIGIHPVSLNAFSRIGIAEQFMREGVRIYRGHAFSGDRKLGTITFSNSDPPFILTMPQFRTEQILEETLKHRSPGTLRRSLELTFAREKADEVEVEGKLGGRDVRMTCDYLVGCDGKESMVRRAAGFSYSGGSYPDTYIMGDYDDNTGFRNDAVVYLSRRGLIESFPIPDNRRRWVVKTERYLPVINRQDIEERVELRIGHSLSAARNHMVSSFGVQRLVASPLASGRILLAGDAAHVVSPIGGQGMNLGWVEAGELAERLQRMVTHPERRELECEEYTQKWTRSAWKVIRRAEFNMWLGKASSLSWLRNTMVAGLLGTPVSRLLSRIFTMQGID